MHGFTRKLAYTLNVVAVSVVVLSGWGSIAVAHDEKSEESTSSLVDENSVVKKQASNSTDPSEGGGLSKADIESLTMTVYKSPSCGCCTDWADYMKEEGFTVKSIDTNDMDSIKAQLGLTAPELKSCHTAVIDGYVIEGHVPANDVKRLLSESPEILGLTAPGMPMMSPGMASRTPKDYNVKAFNQAGETHLWSTY